MPVSIDLTSPPLSGAMLTVYTTRRASPSRRDSNPRLPLGLRYFYRQDFNLQFPHGLFPCGIVGVSTPRYSPCGYTVNGEYTIQLYDMTAMPPDGTRTHTSPTLGISRGSRTPDFLIMIQTFYHLNYADIVGSG